jgi:hypothetical protein
MRTDNLSAHNSDIGVPVGVFFGTPIRELNVWDQDIREDDDTARNVAFSEGKEYYPVEVLPGETIVRNVIRRVTTEEAVGEDFRSPIFQKREACNYLVGYLHDYRVEEGMGEHGASGVIGGINKKVVFENGAPDICKHSHVAATCKDCKEVAEQ